MSITTTATYVPQLYDGDCYDYDFHDYAHGHYDYVPQSDDDF